LDFFSLKKCLRVFFEFVGETLPHKNFPASLGKFRQNSFTPQKFVCSYTYGMWLYVISLFYLFTADPWFISQGQSNSTRPQKWLVIAHYRVVHINTDRRKTLKQRPNYNVIHSSSYRDTAVGEKWRRSNIRFWS